MLIVFASNFLNHHQLPLSIAFLNTPNIEYKFLAFEKIPDTRVQMGYEDMNSKYDFVIKVYESKNNYNEAIELIKKADIFINGYTDKLTKIRLKAKKRVYRFSERYYKVYNKKGFKYSNFYFFLSSLKHVLPYKNKEVVYLAASSYLKNDLNKFYKINNPVLKWGYFPKHIEIAKDNIKGSNRDNIIRLIFVGRLLKWKHPEMAIYALNALPYEYRVNTKLTIVGNGELSDKLNNLVEKLQLTENVSFISSLSANDVRKKMIESDISFFTSDLSEGWGAVLNEEMDSKCACIASIEAGSTNFLIQNGFNGIICSCCNQNEVNNILLKLIEDKKLRTALQNNAYLTIKNDFNGEIAAKRLIEYDKGSIFEEGICSKL